VPSQELEDASARFRCQELGNAHDSIGERSGIDIKHRQRLNTTRACDLVNNSSDAKESLAVHLTLSLKHVDTALHDP
jgi:hypothetical protein